MKKAYHKVSLKVHPDRASKADKEEATKKFQALSHAYSVLADKDRRAVYDDTGKMLYFQFLIYYKIEMIQILLLN